MEQVLLVSENFVKDVTNISDNVRGKLIKPAIHEAQNEDLRGILGDKLLNKLEQLVADDEIDLPANVDYKNLLIRSQYFLAYSAVANICMLTAVKIDNAGLQQVSDEKMNPLSIDDSFRMQRFYQQKSDYHCKQLQNYILQNRTKFPELTSFQLHSIKSNLYSSATCGLWLGGPRNGKRKYWRTNLKEKYDH